MIESPPARMLSTTRPAGLASILAIGDRCIMLDGDSQGMIAQGDPRRLHDESTHPTVRGFFRREAA